jgi:hypothetical protein
METADMLDVLHYFFEQDNEYTSAELAQTRSGVRTRLYDIFYGTTYNYSHKEENSQGFSDGDDFSDITPVDPMKNQTVKPFVPATDVSALGKILDGPVG